MKAAVFVEPGKVEVKEVEKPKIDGENQAIIRKLRRKLRQMEKEKHNSVISEGI